MTNKTINDFTTISSLALEDQFLVYDVSENQTNKVPVSAIVALVSVGAANPVNTSNVAAAGAVMENYFGGASPGYVVRNSSTSYSTVSVIPVGDITGLGDLATQNNVSVGQVSGLGTLATRDNVSVGQVTGLGALATRDDVSVGIVTGLGQLATVNAAVTSVQASQYLMFNGSEWIPTSVTSGGGGATTLDQLTDVSVTNATNNQVLSFRSSDSTWIATSVVAGGSVDASSISAAGGILDSQFSGLGYVRKTGTQTFTGVSTIPSTDVSGLGILATRNDVSTGLVTGLDVFPVTAGQTSGFSPIAYTSTVTSAQNYLNLGTLATTSTAASARSYLALGQLATVSAAVTNAATSQYLMFNGSTWIPTSITSGGGSPQLFNGFKVGFQSNSLSVSNVPVTVEFRTVYYDSASAYSSTTGRYTPTVEGYYKFDTWLRYSVTTTNAQTGSIRILKNNTANDYANSQGEVARVSGQPNTLNYSDIFYMNGTTDFVNVQVNALTGTPVTFSPGLFQGYLIGTTAFEVTVAQSLSDLVDVSIPSPSNNQVLTFNTSSSQWIATSSTGGGSVDASSVAAAGAIMTSYFSGTSGYMRKTSTSTYDVTSAIPAASITGLGTLATTSTAASARSFIEFTSIGTALVVNSSTAASARSVLGLGTLATQSTITMSQISDAASAGRVVLAASVAASIQSYLGYSTVSVLDQLADVSTASAATSQYLMYNGTQWIPTSITSGGGGAGSIVDVTSFTKSDTFTLTGTAAFTDITNFVVSITPKSSSNRILVLVNMMGQSNATGDARLMRDSTPIAIGDAVGNRIRMTLGGYFTTADANHPNLLGMNYLDAPATTGTLAYKLQVKNEGTGNTFYVNRSINDTDSATIGQRGVSTITLMEVQG